MCSILLYFIFLSNSLEILLFLFIALHTDILESKITSNVIWVYKYETQIDLCHATTRSLFEMRIGSDLCLMHKTLERTFPERLKIIIRIQYVWNQPLIMKNEFLFKVFWYFLFHIMIRCFSFYMIRTFNKNNKTNCAFSVVNYYILFLKDKVHQLLSVDTYERLSAFLK